MQAPHGGGRRPVHRGVEEPEDGRHRRVEAHRRRRADQFGGEQQPHQLDRRCAATGPQRHGRQRSVPQDVRLHRQAGAIDLLAELAGPRRGVRPDRGAQPRAVGLRREQLDVVGERLAHTRLAGSACSAGAPLWHPCAELGDVVRSARLGARTHDGVLPPAERLALDDRPGDVPVDVGIADLERTSSHCSISFSSSECRPPVRPNGVAFCSANASSSVSARMIPSTGPKHSVRWRNEPGATPSFRPGDHSRPVSSSCFGSTSHVSPGSSDVRARASLPVGGSISGPIDGVERRRPADAHRFDGVDELTTEPLRPSGRTDQDHERRGRALLAGMPERALHEVGDGQVVVGGRRDDERVLARRLGVDARPAVVRRRATTRTDAPSRSSR